MTRSGWAQLGALLFRLFGLSVVGVRNSDSSGRDWLCNRPIAAGIEIIERSLLTGRSLSDVILRVLKSRWRQNPSKVEERPLTHMNFAPQRESGSYLGDRSSNRGLGILFYDKVACRPAHLGAARR